MNYPIIDPVIFNIGPVAFRWYGLGYVVAFIVCFLLGNRRVRTSEVITQNQWFDILFYCMVGTIVGGRLGYVIFYGWSTFLEDPLWALRPWEGGMAFHGGVIGVALAILLWCMKNKIQFFEITDFITPLVPIGIGIGRLGNFANTELPGRVTDSFLGVHFPCSSVLELNPTCISDYEEVTRHVSSLYQAVTVGVIIFTLMWIYSSNRRLLGRVTGLFVLLMGLGRFITEFFREPDPQLGFIIGNWMTMGQLLSLPMVVLGLVLLIPSMNRYFQCRAVH